MQVIEDEITTCDTIIRNLLEATRPREPRRELIDPVDAIRAAIGRLSVPPDVSVKLEAPAAPLSITFDAVQFRQLLDNLLSNAADAVQSAGHINVRIANTVNETAITVEDSGPGIPTELCEQVFELLFTTRAKGTGLGLSICSEIVQRNGGSLKLANPGSPGARFLITIPNDEGNHSTNSSEMGHRQEQA